MKNPRQERPTPRPELATLAGRTRLITFDCYGTLIDWRTGIRDALGPALGAAGVAWRERLLDRYVEIEARLEAGFYRTYRQVMNTAAKELLEELGVAGAAPQLADSLGRWPAFPDTADALRRLAASFRLGVLSNVDRDLFEQTAAQLGVRLDLLVTAQDVGSYKPAPSHFQRMLQTCGLPQEALLHAAQSLYHDVRPCNDLGLPCVWINRTGEPATAWARPAAEFPDLASFADALLK